MSMITGDVASSFKPEHKIVARGNGNTIWSGGGCFYVLDQDGNEIDATWGGYGVLLHHVEENRPGRDNGYWDGL